MASISRRPDGTWRARYRDPSGNERARHFRRKTDAERWVASQVVAKATGDWTDPKLRKLTVGELGNRLLTTKTDRNNRLWYAAHLNHVMRGWNLADGTSMSWERLP